MYMQCTTDESLERGLVEIALRRDLFLEKAIGIATEVKDRLRPLDEESTLETLALLTAVRDETINIVLQIEQWQKKYTSVQRPVINGGDYMIKFLKHVEFANTLAIKRTFNFQIGRGNLFMLPLINAKSTPAVKVTEKVKAGIEAFSNPDISRLSAATAVLKKSLPKKLLADIMPLEHWISNRWVPKISVCSYFLTEVAEIKFPKIKKPIIPETSSPTSRIPQNPILSPTAQSPTVLVSKDAESLPPLKRMNSDVSVLSQLSDTSVKSTVSLKPSLAADVISRVNSFHPDTASKCIDAPEVPVPAAPIRAFNTLAMRNWFVSENSNSKDAELVSIEGSDNIDDADSKASKVKKKLTTKKI